MGSLLSTFPSAVQIYTSAYYDPLKPKMNKVINPGGALRMTLPLAVKEEGQISPTFWPFFTSQVYRQSRDNQRRMAFHGSDRIELDPFIYKDYRPGMSISWQGGIYQNEAFPGRMSLYEYQNSRRDCACK